MKNKSIVLFGLILLAFAMSSLTSVAHGDAVEEEIIDDITPYDGSVGPGSFLYGLKISFENIDEALTFNETEKLKKHIEHAELRLSEAKSELRNNNEDNANKAIERFRLKIEATDDRITGVDRTDTNLVESQKKIIKHQIVLRKLKTEKPENVEVEKALNRTHRLEEKLELRTKVKLEREVGDDNRVKVHEVEIERKEIESEIEGNRAKISVKVKFISDKTDPAEIKKEILEKLKTNKDDVNRLLNTQKQTSKVDDNSKAEDRLKVKIETGKSISEAEVEFRFILDTIDRNEIVDGITKKLVEVKQEDVQRVEVEVKERREDRHDEAGDDKGGRKTEVGDDRGKTSGTDADKGKTDDKSTTKGGLDDKTTGGGSSSDDKTSSSGGSSGGGESGG